MSTTKQLRNWLFILALAGSVGWAVGGEHKFTESELSYWAYQKVRKPAVPAVSYQAWVKTPVDAFILKELESKKIKPAPRADKITLLRRATFDLTGLPPTPDEVRAFLADTSPNAFAKVVDRLLASPHYGEKWARHWLDLARYAESEGFKSDETRPNVWRYRDYVIKSFNDDKPYDRFVKEQIAGDELWPDNPDAIVATGFNRHYPDESNARNLMQRRQELLNDITDTVGAVFLSATYGCARCHDHKFDPILQKDYYKLQAFFAGVRAKDDYLLVSDAEKAEYERKLAIWKEKTKEIRAQIEQLEAPVAKKIYDDEFIKYPPQVQEAVKMSPDQRGPMEWLMFYKASWLLDSKTDEDGNGIGKRMKGEPRKQWDELRAKLAAFDDIKPRPLPIASGITDVGRNAPPTHVLKGGTYDAPLEEVPPGFLTIIDKEPAKIIPLANTNTTGRRTALANWLTDPQNPLVARVMANRLWHYHFGRGLLATPSDFGLMGETLTNQALLDYLAATFVEKGWHIKAMHRLIMLSSTYQQASDFNSEAAKIDPGNERWWRFPRHRLTGEEIRDAILFTSGQLNPKMGGPSVFPDIPEGMEVRGGWKRNESEAEKNRRSIYVFVRRNSRFPIFQAFDMPDTHESCARRNTTTTAPQALALLNDKATFQAAQSFAGRVLKTAGPDVNAQIATAYQLAFARTPEAAERELARAFLEKQASAIKKRLEEEKPLALPPDLAPGYDPVHAAALVDFCHTLFNANEFVYVN
jgi:hypothetical protein